MDVCVPVFLRITVTVTQYGGQGNAREEGLILTHRLKFQSTVVGGWGESQQEEREAAGYIVSTVKRSFSTWRAGC